MLTNTAIEPCHWLQSFWSHESQDQLANRPTYIISSTTIYQHAHCDHRTNCYLLYLGWQGQGQGTSDGANISAKALALLLSGTDCRITVDPPNFSPLLTRA